MDTGYIYIRTNEYWDIYNAVKLGKTISVLNREQTYITSEIKRGKYIMIIEIDLNILNNIEKQLQIHFNTLNLNIKIDAGTEFYKKDIINLIIPYMDINNIKYTLLTNIDTLVKRKRMYNNIKHKEPEIEYDEKCISLKDYLNFKKVYYDIETCIKKVDEYILLYPEIKKHYLNLSIVCYELCKIDKQFPPNGVWVEYYNIKDLRDIITITHKKKCLSDIL